MRNLRKLLKPGGFLSGDGFIFGALPGWWLGVEEGRNLSPFVDVAQQDAILQRASFSGLDTMAPAKFLDTFGVVLSVTQAVDDRIRFIRNSLSVPDISNIKRLVVVGGESESVAHLAKELSSLFREIAKEVIHYRRLEDIDFGVYNSDAAVISLSELEHPVFKDITSTKWHGFRQLFEGERTVLWVTSGRLEDQPFSNMIVGFGRSAVHENEELRLQFMDIPDVDKVNPRIIAESLCLLHATDIEDERILYTAEPEIIIDTQGYQLVPRLHPISAANDRYNSTQRLITHEIDISESVVELEKEGNDYSMRELSRFETITETVGSNLIELRITHSVLSAIKTPLGHKFAVLGVDASGNHYLVLTSSPRSIVKVSQESAVICNDVKMSHDSFIYRVAATLVAMAIIDPLVAGQKVAIHNASEPIAEIINTYASAKGIHAIFTTDLNPAASPLVPWVRLSPFLSRYDLSQIVPNDIYCLVGLGNETTENELSVLSNLPSYTRRETAQTLYSHKAINSLLPSVDLLRQALKTAVRRLDTFKVSSESSSSKAMSLESLIKGESSNDPISIVNWTPPAVSLPVRVRRLDAKKLFRSDRTYWLCGMSGALGISLCDWMTDQGANYLVFTSRNPKIESTWLEAHRQNGVTVETFPCDVTNEEALRAVHQRIIDTMPPIAGALNGAMVLRDVSVGNMEINHVLDVINPKVLGSIHLDRIFYNVSHDFFILISSINCIISNPGQANYAAANMGICGVAVNRRKRGLNSVCINVGAVIGAGYITESDRQLDQTVSKMAIIHLSEQDFHQIFAEGMEAAHIDCPHGPEMSTGLLDISPDSPNIPKWYSNPMFSRFIVHHTAGIDGKNAYDNVASIQEQLDDCRTEQDVLRVVRQAVSTQLRKILQQSTADDELLRMDSSALGLDSLISVDIRTWFLKSFQVSIPVLKIINRDTQMASLAEFVTEHIPVTLVPQVAGTDDSSPIGDEIADTNAPSNGAQTANGDAAQSITTAPERLPLTIAPSSPPKVVLLTGVSGLLGHHLLQALIQQTSIEKVICIAVRRLADHLATDQLPPASDKVIYYEGDLRHHNFGLSGKVLASIFATVDAVIHNGSDTSHLKYYSDVRESNVLSTHQIVRLCLPRMIPLHYVSSARIAIFSGKEAFPEISATASGKYPPDDGAHGYMCGKWVSERLLKKANDVHGLKVWIHRPSTIIRQGSDAVGEKMEFDWVNALLRYSHVIKAVPKIEHIRGGFDLVHVQSVCDGILRELLHSIRKSDSGITYVNNVGDIVVPFDHLERIGEHEGEKELYELVSISEWTRRVVAAGMHPAVAALIETFDEPGAPMYPTLVKGVSQEA
ncbi:Highly reducing polyketide synthase bet1 [Cladobotryum mycophilum]|uniref:Highly reducing polyketide synthase bet1 n=1 Tax=Cladobotryum mycophilum TaxID=491253 RepID=A0ABR0SPU1_9HYPO